MCVCVQKEDEASFISLHHHHHFLVNVQRKLGGEASKKTNNNGVREREEGRMKEVNFLKQIT